MNRRIVRIIFLVICLSANFVRGDNTEDSPSASNAYSSDPWKNLPLGLSPTRVIDLAIESAWKEHGLVPTETANDAVFLRRVFLDLLGRIPRPSEVHAFVTSPQSQKREQLVDVLLASDEHAEHLAEVLDAILIGRTDAEQLKRRTNAGWFDFLKRSIRDNRSWSDVAKELALARPNSAESQGAVWYVYSRNSKPQDIAEAVSKDLFGVRIDCAQCHDHPLSSEIEQRHYWGLVAFFNRSKNVDTPQGPGVSESAIGGFSEFANLQGKSQSNELVFLGDRKVDESRPAKDAKEEDRDDLYASDKDTKIKVPKFSRRAQFIEKVLDKHPLLASAMVNRIWAWMMGRGLVHPVDAIDSYHPPSHPGLLDWLSRDFENSGYDVRRLIRSIAMTRAYQLSSSSEKFSDPQWFAAGLPKPLTAEMLRRSMVVALEPDDEKPWSSLEYRAAFAKTFPDVLPEDSVANVAQGLLLTNGPSVNDLISAKHSGFLKRVIQETRWDEIESIDRSVSLLFQQILGRPPDQEESSRCRVFLSNRSEQKDGAIEAIAWALLTGSEFRFNH
jgi:hypothetical protein